MTGAIISPDMPSVPAINACKKLELVEVGSMLIRIKVVLLAGTFVANCKSIDEEVLAVVAFKVAKVVKSPLSSVEGRGVVASTAFADKLTFVSAATVLAFVY